MRSLRHHALAWIVWFAFLLSLAPFVGRWVPLIDAFSSFLPVAVLIAAIGLVGAWAVGRRALVGVNVVTLLLCAVVILPEMLARGLDGPVTGPRQRIVIVTHNLLHHNAEPDETLASLSRSDADVLLLQEAKGEIGRRLPELYGRYPYHGECAGKCDLAILSRIPLDRPRWRLRDERGKPYGPPLMWARMHPPGGRSFMIVTVHLPWPLPPGPQRHERADLIAALGHVSRDDMILTGDFNLTPWSAAMGELDRGLEPMRRVTRALPSFPARIGGGAFPVPLLPIDQIFAGPGWHVEEIGRLERTGSDHFPVRIVVSRAN